MKFTRFIENKKFNQTIFETPHYVMQNNSPISSLLIREVEQMIKWAASPERGKDKLSSLEIIVINAYILGYSVSCISKKLKCSRQNVSRAKNSAIKKIMKYKPEEFGLLTVLMEEFGVEIINEYMSDFGGS